jgi:hypothetical protein
MFEGASCRDAPFFMSPVEMTPLPAVFPGAFQQDTVIQQADIRGFGLDRDR